MKSNYFLRQFALLVLAFLTSPVQSFSGVDAFFQTSPYAAAAMVNGVKGICADLVAQRHQWKQRQENGEDLDVVLNPNGLAVAKTIKHKIDLKRMAVSLFYCALYHGVVMEHTYSHIYPQLFGHGGDPLSVLRKVSFDMLVQSPLVTLPVAYITKSFVFGYSVREAFRKYVDDVLHHKLLVKYYSLWIPVMSVAFGVVPGHLRIAFLAMVSFFWNILLSLISNKNPAKIAKEACPLEDGITCKINE